MNKSTFDHLCNELRPHIARQTTVFREPVSVEERVAITLWKLATNVEYRTLASLFGLAGSQSGYILWYVAIGCRECKLLQHHVFH